MPCTRAGQHALGWSLGTISVVYHALVYLQGDRLLKTSTPDVEVTNTTNPRIAMTKRPRHSRRMTASLIGAILGLIYILVNADALPSPEAPVLRIIGIVSFVVLMARLRAASTAEPLRAPSAETGFGRSYWLVVALEAIAALGGATILSQAFSTPRADLPWITLIVGTHFFALAVVFHQSRYHAIGAMITTCGVAGLIAVAAGASDAVTSTLAGIAPGIMLLAAAFHGTTPNTTSQATADTNSTPGRRPSNRTTRSDTPLTQPKVR